MTASAEVVQHLTEAEVSQLAEHEQVIEHGVQTFYEVGRALLDIRNRRLYRENFGTFEDYCRDRWGMDKRYANRTIEAAALVTQMGPIGPIPRTESQARELVGLPAEDARDVYREATDRSNGHPTAATIREVRAEREPEPSPELLEQRHQEEIEEGRRRTMIHTAEAVYMLAWGPNELQSFIRNIYPAHAGDVPNGMRLTSERLDAAIATLTTIREQVTT
jgi:hypothetical protein